MTTTTPLHRDRPVTITTPPTLSLSFVSPSSSGKNLEHKREIVARGRVVLTNRLLFVRDVSGRVLTTRLVTSHPNLDSPLSSHWSYVTLGLHHSLTRCDCGSLFVKSVFPFVTVLDSTLRRTCKYPVPGTRYLFPFIITKEMEGLPSTNGLYL